jgi:hypothetical protein
MRYAFIFSAVSFLMMYESASGALLNKRIETSWMSLARTLAMYDLHRPSLGYCYADVMERGDKTSAYCMEALQDAAKVADGLGITYTDAPSDRDLMIRAVVEAWKQVVKSR